MGSDLLTEETILARYFVEAQVYVPELESAFYYFPLIFEDWTG